MASRLALLATTKSMLVAKTGITIFHNHPWLIPTKLAETDKEWKRSRNTESGFGHKLNRETT
nr:hypothetical protein [Roseofilum sp. SID3]